MRQLAERQAQAAENTCLAADLNESSPGRPESGGEIWVRAWVEGGSPNVVGRQPFNSSSGAGSEDSASGEIRNRVARWLASWAVFFLWHGVHKV